MSDSGTSLRRKINSATDLYSVVRSMKAMAAANTGQYEGAVLALDDYYRTIELALFASFRQHQPMHEQYQAKQRSGVLVFGSDQGLVGQFNDLLADFVIADLHTRSEDKIIWCIGERLQARLAEADLPLASGFVLPKSLHAIPPLISEILQEMERHRAQGNLSQVLLFHNQPKAEVIYQPVSRRLLPLDERWIDSLKSISWPSRQLPQVINTGRQTLLAFVHEYLFVSLYRACAESLASENASRLATMLRAEKTIDELLDTMTSRFHLLRQSSIDEELFDLIAGFELLE